MSIGAYKKLIHRFSSLFKLKAKAASRCFLPLLPLCITMSAHAIEIPLFINWDSINNGYINYAQPHKRISWDEFYRIGLGVDSLEIEGVKLSLLLQNQADFIENHVQIKHINLLYSHNEWHLHAQSAPKGYGKRNTLANRHIVYPAQDDYLYQESRFNGLGVAYQFGQAMLELNWGGNKHNQSSAYAQLAWEKPDNSFSITATQDARTQDSHWRRPSYTSAIKIVAKKDLLAIYTELAATLVPARDGASSKYGVMRLAELSYGINPHNVLFISGDSTKPVDSELTLSRLRMSYSRHIGTFSITPGLTVNLIDSVSRTSYHILGEWQVKPNQSLGLLYSREETDGNNYRHGIGVQARLTYGL